MRSAVGIPRLLAKPAGSWGIATATVTALVTGGVVLLAVGLGGSTTPSVSASVPTDHSGASMAHCRAALADADTIQSDLESLVNDLAGATRRVITDMGNGAQPSDLDTHIIVNLGTRIDSIKGGETDAYNAAKALCLKNR